MDKAEDYFYKGVVIENTFTSIADMAAALFPFFKFAPWLIKIMLKLEWNNL